jgi:two-component system LytT family sensor kinase
MKKTESPIRVIVTICAIVGVLIPAYFFIYYWLKGTPIASFMMLANVFFTLLITCLISLANMFTMEKINQKIPWHKNKTKRFILEFVLTNFNAVFIISIVFLILFKFFSYRQMVPEIESMMSMLYDNIIIALIVNTIVVSILEGQYLIRQWINSIVEVEKLKREKAESQYAVLKNQVNPHFLFNSLNSLSSLIRVSPEKAIDFVDKFSKIYRYVLEVSEKIVVELREELDFLQSYYFLQKIRFGDNLEIKLEIDSIWLNKFVPPLSLQILVENAIKHNEISKEHPLKIIIYVKDEFLVISNNLQLKKNMEGTTGIGLNNLSQRYDHLTEIKSKFYTTQYEYISMIPLLNE